MGQALFGREATRGLVQRLSLVYTGQQGLAKNLLRNVMGAGGSFAIALARDSAAAQQSAEALATRSAGTRVAVWPSGVPEKAMHVNQ